MESWPQFENETYPRASARGGVIVTVSARGIAGGGGGVAIAGAGTVRVTVGLALALCVWKLVATSATIGTGAPGGVVSPSLAVAAGAGLLTWWALDGLGVGLPDARWDAVLVTASADAMRFHDPPFDLTSTIELALAGAGRRRRLESACTPSA